MDFTFKKMDIQDLEEIKDVLLSDFDDFWSYEVLREELLSDSSLYIVAKKQNEIIGFAGIKIIIDEADIMNIVVKKSYRNNGNGSLLLENLILISNKKNLNFINLEVDCKNTIAINLYKKFGFEEISLRKNYYKNNDAMIMKKKLP
mgnify:FL=1